MVKFEVLFKIDRKTDSLWMKSAYFPEFFLWNKGNFDIPLFDKFPNFDPNKGKISLFGLHTVLIARTSGKTVKRCEVSVRKSAPLRKDSVCQDKGRVNKCYVTTRGFLSSVEWRVQFWKSAVKRKHTEGSSFFTTRTELGHFWSML